MVEITFMVTKCGDKQSVKVKASDVSEAWKRLQEKISMEDVEKVVLTTTRCL